MQNSTKESPQSLIASLPPEQRQAFVAGLTPEMKRILLHKWRGWYARPDQLPPSGAWRVWLLVAGRGYGKTRSGAEWVRAQVERKIARRIALVAETATDARQVMVEGESGILAISPPSFRPIYEPSKRQLRWPNGAIATLYSADQPDQLRGPQHDAAWADEPAKWRYPEKTWDNLEFGLRLGADPRVVATTTPRPIPWLRKLMADPLTAVTRGSTYDNLQHLPSSYIRRVIQKYDGTRLGRQELMAEMLEDVPGALWTHQGIEAHRVCAPPCEMVRIVVAIDPAVSCSEDSDETGILIIGLGTDGHGYVLKDLSGRMLPLQWAQQAIDGYRHFRADLIVGEVNNGGDLVENVLRTVDPHVSFRAVHASRGKFVRAEPIASMYEQGFIHHVGMFPELEDQMCSFVPGETKTSPDRLDAAVWALTELYLEEQKDEQIVYFEDRVRISPY